MVKGKAEFLHRIEIGEHVGYYEEPDLLWLEFHGGISADQVIEYVEIRAGLLEGQPRILTLLDVRDMTDLPADARAAIARLRDPRPQASAVIGASFRMRVIAELVVKAAYLFTGKMIQLGFFEEVEEGHAWLVEMRGKI